MSFLFGTDYSAAYGGMPLEPQAPGTLNVLNNPQMFVPQEVSLIMRGRLMSWTDSADISYVNGPAFARVRGRAMSLRDKHTLECLDGTPLLNVKQPLLGFGRTYEVYFGDDSARKAAEVKLMNWGAQNVKLGVFLPDQKSTDPIVTIKGNSIKGEYFGFLGNPKEGGRKILNIIRSGMMGAALLGGNKGALSFQLGIAANVDIGLMLAIVAALDDLEAEKLKNSLPK